MLLYVLLCAGAQSSQPATVDHSGGADGNATHLVHGELVQQSRLLLLPRRGLRLVLGPAPWPEAAY